MQICIDINKYEMLINSTTEKKNNNNNSKICLI